MDIQRRIVFSEETAEVFYLVMAGMRGPDTKLIVQGDIFKMAFTSVLRHLFQKYVAACVIHGFEQPPDRVPVAVMARCTSFESHFENRPYWSTPTDLGTTELAREVTGYLLNACVALAREDDVAFRHVASHVMEALVALRSIVQPGNLQPADFNYLTYAISALETLKGLWPMDLKEDQVEYTLAPARRSLVAMMESCERERIATGLTPAEIMRHV